MRCVDPGETFDSWRDAAWELLEQGIEATVKKYVSLEWPNPQ